MASQSSATTNLGIRGENQEGCISGICKIETFGPFTENLGDLHITGRTVLCGNLVALSLLTVAPDLYPFPIENNDLNIKTTQI